MARRWAQSIRERGTLTIYLAPNASRWAESLTTAIARFNDLSGKLGLGLTYVRFQAPPSPDDLTGADVQLAAANGLYTYRYGGTQSSHSMPPGALMGKTWQVYRSPPDEIEKAFIFLPAHMGPGFRRMATIVHELVHAAGLHDSDHSSVKDPDIFCGVITGNSNQVYAGELAMPPLYMTRRTAAKIQAIW